MIKKEVVSLILLKVCPCDEEMKKHTSGVIRYDHEKGMFVYLRELHLENAEISETKGDSSENTGV